MGKTRGALAVAALVLAGCGTDTTPEGLARSLADQGVALDGTTSPQRYYDAVTAMCDQDGDYSPNTLLAFAREDNAEALDRMVAGMGYVCPGQGDGLALMVEAIGD